MLLKLLFIHIRKELKVIIYIFDKQIEAAGIEKYSALNGDMAKQLEYVYSFLEDDEELRNIPMNVIPPEENVPR